MEGSSLLEAGCMCGVRKVTRNGMIMVQKGCQQSLTNQHTNCLGEKALESLESSAKDKKSICPKPVFPSVQWE